MGDFIGKESFQEGHDFYEPDEPSAPPLFDDPTIRLTTVSPNTVFVSGGPTVITLTGTGFTPDCVITETANWPQPMDIPTTYVSDTQVTALYNVTGVPLGTHIVAVRKPDGGCSNTKTFAVVAAAEGEAQPAEEVPGTPTE